MNALEIKDLSKSFPGFSLDKLNLTLPSGCILGLIGENGAGKSTTIKLILDMLHTGSGSITVLGQDHKALNKNEIGVVLDEAGFPSVLNAKEIGSVMALSFSNWDSAEYERLLTKLALPREKAFHTLSRGNKMKLGIAVALSHHCRLLILDEATNGLDPVVRDEVLDMLCEFTRDEGHTVLLSSHIVSDLEKICDYIAFLHKGKLMLMEEKDRLLEEYAVLRTSREEMDSIPPEAIHHRKDSSYGATALIHRARVSPALALSPVNLEELFLYMVKEG